jgi:hypothetical protein
MAGEKRAAGPKDPVTGKRTAAPRRGSDHDGNSPATTRASPDTVYSQFFRSHALSLIIFCLAFFFIVTITNPGLYINDEWITANQLHQLDIGHQVTFSEGKYGTLENGTASAYFTSRQNVLMYSLALPLLALPLVKIFGIFGDNFRLLIILIWSASLVVSALLMDAFYPLYFRIGRLRLLYPVLFLSLILFMVNVLLYKQFPFSAPDAPFEVAALVLANHICFRDMSSCPCTAVPCTPRDGRGYFLLVVPVLGRNRKRSYADRDGFYLRHVFLCLLSFRG